MTSDRDDFSTLDTTFLYGVKDMTTYKEGSSYVLSVDYYNQVVLLCTCVEDGIAYLLDERKHVHYKQNIKTQKLYVFNTQYQSWDTVKDTLKPLSESSYSNSGSALSSMNDFLGD